MSPITCRADRGGVDIVTVAGLAGTPRRRRRGRTRGRAPPACSGRWAGLLTADG